MKAQWFMIQDVFPQNTYIQAYPTNTFYIKKRYFYRYFFNSYYLYKKICLEFQKFLYSGVSESSVTLLCLSTFLSLMKS